MVAGIPEPTSVPVIWNLATPVANNAPPVCQPAGNNKRPILGITSVCIIEVTASGAASIQSIVSVKSVVSL